MFRAPFCGTIRIHSSSSLYSMASLLYHLGPRLPPQIPLFQSSNKPIHSTSKHFRWRGRLCYWWWYQFGYSYSKESHNHGTATTISTKIMHIYPKEMFLILFIYTFTCKLAIRNKKFVFFGGIVAILVITGIIVVSILIESKRFSLIPQVFIFVHVCCHSPLWN